MIAGLKPYPVMKDSGVEWLGELPEHWDALPNRALFDEIKERGHPDEDMLSVTIKKDVIRQAALLADSSKKDSSNLDKSKYKLVLPGDIAYNKMRAWQGAIGTSMLRGIISPAYVVQRPREGGNSSYFNHLFRIPSFAKEAERWSYGITSDMWSLRPEHFKLIYSCRPPVAEQAAIVRYLDHVDRRVRRLVRAKRKLIALLTEQKQAIIHRAVTRGLDPDVPLKHSGVEWLGEVPAHWDVVALRRRWAVTDCKHLTVPFVEDEDSIPLASVREVQSFELSLATAKRTTYENYSSLIDGARKPVAGDLIYCRNVSLGAAAIVATKERFAMGQDVCLIRSARENQRFLNYFLHSPAMDRQLSQLLVGSTFNRINVADIKSPLVAVPPRSEQDEIVAFLDDALVEIEEARGMAKKAIDLLTEYRTRLTADVVTGKLDVREAAAALPEVDPLAADDGPDTLDAESESDPDELDAIAEEEEA